MWGGVVLQRDAILVLDRHAQDGISVHLEGPVLERSHGVDPGLLCGVHEAGVDPACHSIDLWDSSDNSELVIRQGTYDHASLGPEQC